MDPLSDILSLIQPQSYHVGGFDVGGSFSVRFEPHAGIKCYAVTSGQGWLVLDGAAPLLLRAGECVLLPRGLPFRVTSDPALPAEDWRKYFPGPRDGSLVRINGGGGVSLIGGFFSLAGPQAAMLLGMLPPIVHLKDAADSETLQWTFERMRQELADPRPGSLLIAQQLAYTILIQALRLHLGERGNVGWLFALSDRQIGAAIGAIHRDPAKRWTVETLAAEVGMSRSSFAARFRELVGEGPIEYLTRWRMLLAGRSLARGEPVGAIARQLGYESESAFSTAFKRVMGNPPRRHAQATAEREVEVA